jgi:hypothetical protein
MPANWDPCPGKSTATLSLMTAEGTGPEDVTEPWFRFDEVAVIAQSPVE